MVTVREVTPDELFGLVPFEPTYMTPIAWAVIDDGHGIVGHGCVSRLHGRDWAHDLAHWGDEPTAVLRLYRFLTKLARERGVTTILTDVSSDAMVKLYRALGWSLKSVILEGDLTPSQKGTDSGN